MFASSLRKIVLPPRKNRYIATNSRNNGKLYALGDIS